MNRIVTEIWYNWGYNEEYGENYYIAKVGEKGISKIRHYKGQEHYCEIFYENSKMEIIYKLNKVFTRNENN